MSARTPKNIAAMVESFETKEDIKTETNNNTNVAVNKEVKEDVKKDIDTNVNDQTNDDTKVEINSDDNTNIDTDSKLKSIKEKMKAAKKKDSNKQVTVYLTPENYKRFNALKGKGAKSDLINELLNLYFEE